MSAVWGPPLRRMAGEPASPYVRFALDATRSGPAAQGTAVPCGAGWPGRPLFGDGTCSAEAPRADALFEGVSRDVSALLADAFGAAPPLFLSDVILGRGRTTPAERAGPRRASPREEWVADDCVFVGIVDDAIAFAHERFRMETACGPRTRFDYLWAQGAPHEPGGAVPFGREIAREAIDDLLEAHRRAGGIDEAGLYRDPRCGMVDMRRVDMQNGHLGRSHGTAVLDAAAGFSPVDPEARRFPIAAVSLPAQVTADTSGTFAAYYVAAGIERILAHVEARAEAARRKERGFPLVVNVSLALTGGPKDGRGLLDAYLEDAAARWAGRGPLKFVFAAGNHRQSRTYARLESAREAERALWWRLPPDDATPSFLEIWSETQDRRPEAPGFAAALRPPHGADPGVLKSDGFDLRRELVRDGRAIAVAYWDWVAARDGGGRERLTIAVAPTVAADRAACAPPGDWRVEVRSARWPVELFIQRDDSVQSFRRRGRQSAFVDLDYETFLPNGRMRLDDEGSTSSIRRAGSISGFATGRVPIVAAARLARAGERGPAPRPAIVVDEGLPGDEAAPYSGLPKAGAPARVAGVERSRACGGILGATAHSGGCCAVAGTSMAAAAVTRRLARDLT